MNNNSIIRKTTTPAKSVPGEKPVFAQGIDVTKITNIESGNQAIDNFAKKIADANKTKSNSILVSLSEANAIFANLSSIVSNNIALQEQVFELQQKIIETKLDEKINIKFDGGYFKKDK